MQGSASDFYGARELRKREAMAARKAAGEAMHLAPLGFRNARDAEGRSVIEPDPETYPLVMEALAMRGRGDSIRTICRVMRQKGLRSKRGNRIGPGAMHSALVNAAGVQRMPKLESLRDMA